MITRMSYQSHAVLDDGRVLMRVVEWSEVPAFFGLLTRTVATERTYSFAPGVGLWFDDRGIEIRASDLRLLWLGRCWIMNRTSEAVDRRVLGSGAH